MGRADKKQRHKTKREAKRKQARRLQSISPLKRLADAAGEVEFWMSDDFDFMGQAQIFAFKQGAGLSGIACFLVDKGVVGLKDAWSRLHINRRAFDDMLESCEERGFPMHRAMPETARGMIAAGIRWAHDNGMRLPRDWPKTASLIGGVGDWASADVSRFVKEFCGHPEDLRQRLIGEPFHTYIQRTDIRFVFSDAAPYMDQESGEYVDADDDDDDFDSHYPENRLDAQGEDWDEGKFESFMTEVGGEMFCALQEMVNPAATDLAAETAGWLAAGGGTPSTELVEGWRSILLSVVIPKMSAPNLPPGELPDIADYVLEGIRAGLDPRRLPEYDMAVDQAFGHLEVDDSVLRIAITNLGAVPPQAQAGSVKVATPARLPSAGS